MPGTDMMEKCCAFKEQAAVDFVGEHHDVAVADGLGHLLDVLARHDAAGRVLRRIENDELGAVGDQRGQFVDIERKSRSSRSWMGTALPPM